MKILKHLLLLALHFLLIHFPKLMMTQRKSFFKDNKIVRGHLLNHMSNSLFDNVVKQKFVKDIWDLLEVKYGREIMLEKRNTW